MNENIKTKAYAAFDETWVLRPWKFERRPMWDDDIIIDIKFASICDSDIHQMTWVWWPQKYPQVPWHEIVWIVRSVWKNVTKFKVWDRAWVGCMVNSCLECDSCKHHEEQFCDNWKTLFTYGYQDSREPTGITQWWYSDNIVVNSHFAVHIPENIRFEEAAPLLCAWITTYSPLIKSKFKAGDKVWVAGIGGLGHLAVKLASSMWAEVYAFTTSDKKVDEILSFGAKEVIIVDSPAKLFAMKWKLDYMISTIPVQYDVWSYALTVKPNGYFTQVGMPKWFSINVNLFWLCVSRVNFNASLIGWIKETQEVVNYCAENKIYPHIEVISADKINEVWKKIMNKNPGFRYVIDTSTL